MKLKYLSVGNNKKLGKNVGVFNLPSHKTCPGQTNECGLLCYASKAEKMYKGAKLMRERNYKFSKNKEFVNTMIDELIASKCTHVRVHESGDFFNQEYVDKWMKIVDACPDIEFLAFTKSFHLDFSKAPKNLALYCSVDKSTTLKPIKGRPLALTIWNIKDKPKGYRYCWPIGKDKNGNKDPNHYHRCGDGCTYCWTSRKDVSWLKH